MKSLFISKELFALLSESELQPIVRDKLRDMRSPNTSLDAPLCAYQKAILRMMASVPEGYHIKTIMQGGRTYHFATIDGAVMSYRYDGLEWVKC